MVAGDGRNAAMRRTDNSWSVRTSSPEARKDLEMQGDRKSLSHGSIKFAGSDCRRAEMSVLRFSTRSERVIGVSAKANVEHVALLGIDQSANLCQALARRCPLWVKSGHVRCKRACPLYPRKRH